MWQVKRRAAEGFHRRYLAVFLVFVSSGIRSRLAWRETDRIVGNLELTLLENIFHINSF
ncbi:hypothetical protein AK973_3783 [Pseudomonas brassicacearum]|nr:hypothetical protein AK973_3783 [Pseudomonas brassicacearum]